MNPWVDQALKRLNEQRANQQAFEAYILRKQEVEQAYGMPLWLQVRKVAEDNCAEFNLEAKEQLLKYETGGDTELTVTSTIDKNTRRLAASFDISTGNLSWSCDRYGGLWTVEPCADGACLTGPYGPAAPEVVADQMLNALVW